MQLSTNPPGKPDAPGARLSPRRACDNCGESDPTVSLKPCKRCKVTYYCDRACQTEHWKRGGHKEVCKSVEARPDVGEPAIEGAPEKTTGQATVVSSQSAAVIATQCASSGPSGDHCVVPPPSTKVSNTSPQELSSKAKKKLLVKVCANCEASENDETLYACSRCLLVYYCGRPCQDQHWTQGFHKRFCITPEERSASSLAALNPELPTVLAAGLKEETVASSECTICKQPMTLYSSSFLPCSHSFHYECVEDLRSFADAKCARYVVSPCRRPLRCSFRRHNEFFRMPFN